MPPVDNSAVTYVKSPALNLPDEDEGTYIIIETAYVDTSVAKHSQTSITESFPESKQSRS